MLLATPTHSLRPPPPDSPCCIASLYSHFTYFFLPANLPPDHLSRFTFHFILTSFNDLIVFNSLFFSPGSLNHPTSSKSIHLSHLTSPTSALTRHPHLTLRHLLPHEPPPTHNPPTRSSHSLRTLPRQTIPPRTDCQMCTNSDTDESTPQRAVWCWLCVAVCGRRKEM